MHLLSFENSKRSCIYIEEINIVLYLFLGGYILKKLKFNYTKLILIFICIYVLSNILSGIIKKNADTLILENQVVRESFKKKGLVIRDEYLLESSMDGKVKYCIKEGNKIKKVMK